MTDKEENIVNIALKASELIAAGRIKPNDIEGHMGFTSNIISLADQFERQYGHIDYNEQVDPEEPIPDYWEDIELFAERELLSAYGLDHDENQVKLWVRVGMTLMVSEEVFQQLQSGDTNLMHAVLRGERGKAFLDGNTYFPDIEQNGPLSEVEFWFNGTEAITNHLNYVDKPLQIKVILDEGIVEAALKDQNIPVNVEVVDINKDYSDYEQLKDYRSKLYADAALVNCDFKTANFENEAENIFKETELGTLSEIMLVNQARIFLNDNQLMGQFLDEEQPRFLRSRIQDIRNGDGFLIGNCLHTADGDAHQNIDEPDCPWVVYDVGGDSWFEEDVVNANLYFTAQQTVLHNKKISLDNQIQNAQKRQGGSSIDRQNQLDEQER